MATQIHKLQKQPENEGKKTQTQKIQEKSLLSFTLKRQAKRRKEMKKNPSVKNCDELNLLSKINPFHRIK